MALSNFQNINSAWSLWFLFFPHFRNFPANGETSNQVAHLSVASGQAGISNARSASALVELEALQASLQIQESRLACLPQASLSRLARLVRLEQQGIPGRSPADHPGAWRLVEIPFEQGQDTKRIRLRLFRGVRLEALPRNW